jgi:hypothetical protein
MGREVIPRRNQLSWLFLGYWLNHGWRISLLSGSRLKISILRRCFSLPVTAGSEWRLFRLLLVHWFRRRDLRARDQGAFSSTYMKIVSIRS